LPFTFVDTNKLPQRFYALTVSENRQIRADAAWQQVHAPNRSILTTWLRRGNEG